MYDCYVIGSGPAGITLALEPAKANRRVLLFESGTAIDARADMPNAINYGHLRDGWWDQHSIRALGGTSKVWTGWCVTLQERDFNNPAAGVRWPITRPELVPYYRRAAEVLDRDASIIDVETPLVPGFVYRPFSRAVPTRFDLKYFDVLEKSSTIHVALASSVVGLDADTSRSAVHMLTYFHHSSGTTHQNVVGSPSMARAAPERLLRAFHPSGSISSNTGCASGNGVNCKPAERFKRNRMSPSRVGPLLVQRWSAPTDLPSIPHSPSSSRAAASATRNCYFSLVRTVRSRSATRAARQGSS